VKLVFDRSSDFESVERAYDGGDMTGLRGFNNSKSMRVLFCICWGRVNWDSGRSIY